MKRRPSPAPLALGLACLLLVLSTGCPAPARSDRPPTADEARAAARELSGAMKPESPGPELNLDIPWRAIGISALVLLLLGAGLGLGRVLYRRIKRAGGTEPRTMAAAGPEPHASAVLAAEAIERAARGEPGTALSLLHAATLALLLERGLVRDDPSLTSGDIARRLPEAYSRAYRPIARKAEAREFGFLEPSGADWAEAKAHFDDLLGMAS